MSAKRNRHSEYPAESASPQQGAAPLTPIIEMVNVSMTFSGHHVLRNLSLQIAKGETVAIIGESGCGKSVLMKTVIGLTPPSSGQVYFDGQELTRLNPRELSRQRIRFGFVFQQAALFDSLTIGQNVAFPLRQHTNLTTAEVREIVRGLLAEVGMPESAINRKPAEISGGMRKRVGLARALALNPEVILYDEPTTGLDPIMSDVINELMMKTSRRSHTAGIVVTHDMKSARKVADRVIMIYPLGRLRADEPQILFDGSPSELDDFPDPRVRQFVHGEAGERLMEMRREASEVGLAIG
jgi:phospholipid/cholesterol/gamma-HCH transport system ATP-binding protein